MPGSGRVGIRPQGHSGAATGDRRSRRVQGRKVSEFAGAGQAGGGFPRAGSRFEDASADFHSDAARTRDPEVAGRGQFGQGNRGLAGVEREDRGGPQVQPDAQTGHPQQGPVGDLRDSEKDHQDTGQPVSAGISSAT